MNAIVSRAKSGIAASLAAVFNKKTTLRELAHRSAQFSCECGVICGVVFWAIGTSLQKLRKIA
jgi:hypothetical protein